MAGAAAPAAYQAFTAEFSYSQSIGTDQTMWVLPVVYPYTLDTLEGQSATMRVVMPETIPSGDTFTWQIGFRPNDEDDPAHTDGVMYDVSGYSGGQVFTFGPFTVPSTYVNHTFYVCVVFPRAFDWEPIADWVAAWGTAEMMRVTAT